MGNPEEGSASQGNSKGYGGTTSKHVVAAFICLPKSSSLLVLQSQAALSCVFPAHNLRWHTLPCIPFGSHTGKLQEEGAMQTAMENAWFLGHQTLLYRHGSCF